MENMSSVIDNAVKKIAENRFDKMKRDVSRVYANYLPAERLEFSDGDFFLRDGFSQVVKFDKELEEKIMDFFIRQERINFENLAKNLSKYLEVHTAGY